MELDHKSPLPLYHQLAEAVRYRIATGEYRAGSPLPSVRAGAKQWGVNLHTVRRAYGVLEETGLVHSSRLGTVVAEQTRSSDALNAFLKSLIGRAHDEFGLDVHELQRQLALVDSADPSQLVYVVECSESQAADLASRLSATWKVSALGWSLERPGEPPNGIVLATYFHYNDIRRRWPDRFADIQFVAIRPDPALATRVAALKSGKSEVLVGERDKQMAANIASDLKAILPSNLLLKPLVSESVEHLSNALIGDQIVVFAPRVWASLTPAARADPWSLEIQYVFDELDIRGVATRLGWTHR